ncbi:MAG: putative maltokinase [Chloroflexi bacterium]|nr:putative maltokinase [Chloroflexota bacterium]
MSYLEREHLLASLPAIVAALPLARLQAQRWFGEKSRAVARLALVDAAPLGEGTTAVLALVDAVFEDRSRTRYFLPLALRPVGEGETGQGEHKVRPYDAHPTGEGADGMPGAWAVARVADRDWAVVDAFDDPTFCRALYRRIREQSSVRSVNGTFRFTAGPHPPAAVPEPDPTPRGGDDARQIRRLGVEQSNTSVLVDEAYLLKCFRRLHAGPNPDLEIGRFLARYTTFRQTPSLAGAVEYAGADGYESTIGMLQAFVPNAGDGWQYTLDHLRSLFAEAGRTSPPRLPFLSWSDAERGDSARVRGDCPPLRPRRGPAQERRSWEEAMAAYLDDAWKLGRMTGALHAALASDHSQPEFAPEPVEPGDWRSCSAHIAGDLDRVMALLERRVGDLPPVTRDLAGRVIASRGRLRACAAELTSLAGLPMQKMRHHGDYHLGQVLRTADGFIVLDFEGEPARTLDERRMKHTPLRDIAGMLRSFDYARHVALRMLVAEESGDMSTPAALGEAWLRLVTEAFVGGYLAAARESPASFLPPFRADLDRLLAIFQLEKAIYEVGYELDNRPEWLAIPLSYLVHLASTDVF